MQDIEDLFDLSYIKTVDVFFNLILFSLLSQSINAIFAFFVILSYSFLHSLRLVSSLFLFFLFSHK